MRWSIVLVAVLTLAVGCVDRTPDSPWRELPLPQPGARILAFAPTPGSVLALGSIPAADVRAPAAWSTTDGTHWTAVPVHPETPYGARAELLSAGTGDRTVVLGRAFGGAHSNPRMSVWGGDAHGLTEHEQAFEMFGGPHAIAVSAAGALGGVDLLVGDWDGPTGRYGAAYWVSADGANWERHADDPALSSAPGEQTGAAAIGTGPAGFAIVGETLRDNIIRPVEWTSPDGGRWQRLELPGANAVASGIGCTATCTVFGQSVGADPHVLCWPTPDTGPLPGPAARNVDVQQVVPTPSRMLALIAFDHRVSLVSVSSNCTDWQQISLPVPADQARMATLPLGLLVTGTDAEHTGLWLYTR
ncbi:hypothetical protein ACFV4K_30950 [Nocardia sp. NPDC059764]|uniref:hypothetical protein n=1 Tax=Nocardia sp. NPDC059764 TaxID=3346939 RepID=UPI0036613A1B